MLELTNLHLYYPQLPQALENLRILHIGDLHAKGHAPREEALLDVVGQGCDLIVGTGDSCHQTRITSPFRNDKQGRKPSPPGFYWNEWVLPAHTAEALDLWKRMLVAHACPLGAYTVQGNHDPDTFMHDIAQIGVTVLANQTVQIRTPSGTAFNLTGIQCFGRATIDLPLALREYDPDLFGITLCHYPEMTEALAGAHVDLILAGHTHGGQVCLPSGKPLTTHSRTGSKYVTGLERLGPTYVHITRGLGQSTLPIRLFCPAQIARITLHRGPHDQTTRRSQRLI